MRTAASSFPNPVAGALDGADRLPTPKVLARRAKQRRQMLGMIGVSYVIDAAILLIYAYCRDHPGDDRPGIRNLRPRIGRLLHHAVGSRHSTTASRIITSSCSSRWSASRSCWPSAISRPQVGILFLCTLFVVFCFSALRSTPRQTAIAWTAMAFGLAALFLLTDKPISMPHATHLERFATMLVFVLTIGRCMFLGIFASSLRESLYKRGVQLKEAYKRIEELAELDELTGSFNRRCIMRMLDDEIARAHRTKTPFSVALIDLDWFKRINDAYGHPTGDEVLRTFAITVFANIRNIDRFGRYGGEEFLLILPETPHDVAARILDRQREIIADLDWSAFSPGMSVTISAGVATLAPDEAPDALLARADSALYAAKARGRNRIASA